MAITNGYASLSEVKAAARITDSVDDSLLETAIEASSRMIDGYCERRFYTNGTEVRYFAARDSYTVEVDDLAGTAITVETSSGLDGIYDETLTASDYQLEPLNRTNAGLDFPATRLRAVGDYLFPVDPVANETGVKITGVYGFATAVPAAVKQACILASLRQYQRYSSALGVAGFGDMGAVRVARIDPDIQSMLMPFRKVTHGVA
jgi:hypothetical protein